MYAKYKVEVNIGTDEQDKNSPMNKGKSSDDNWREEMNGLYVIH
jgi:hypothetical protein